MSSDHLEEPGEMPPRERSGDHPTGQDPATRDPVHRADSGWSWRLVGLGILAAILIVLVIIALGIYGTNRNDKAKAADQTLAEFADGIAKACVEKPAEARAAGIQCSKAKEIDDRPSGEKGEAGAQGPKGDPGKPGLSAAQVQAIVATAIRNYQPTLTPSQVEQIARVTAPKVVRPRDGRTPTAVELQPLVAVAVTSFCGEDRCVGRVGPKGDKGNDAPPVSDERLSALIDTSLKAYCAQHNGCVGADSTVPGPTGPAGPAGPTGAAGRGITSGPTCIGEGADSYWLTKYSDDTEQRQDGPCRLQPLLPPATPAKR